MEEKRTKLKQGQFENRGGAILGACMSAWIFFLCLFAIAGCVGIYQLISRLF